MAKKATQEASDVFTALLALAVFVTLATAAYIGWMCWNYYGTLFSIVQTPR